MNKMHILEEVQSLISQWGVFKDLQRPFDSPFHEPYDHELMIIVGTGGSNSGTKALFQMMDIHDVYYLDDMAPERLAKAVRLAKNRKTIVFFISKSGETLETLFQAHRLYDELSSQQNVRFFGITQNPDSTNKDSTLSRFLKERSITLIDHPSDVGGRFSVFSCVSMIPFFLKKNNASLFRKHALDYFNAFLTPNSPETDCAYESVCFYQEHLSAGKNILVFGTYGERLYAFGKWFCMLFAETLGKTKAFGITPMHSIFPLDYHSQLQMFADGPSDKMYFLNLMDIETDDAKALESPALSKTSQDAIRAFYEAGAVCLHPARTQIITSNDYYLAKIFAKMIIEVVALAVFWKLNPFDQPGVECLKKKTWSLLR